MAKTRAGAKKPAKKAAKKAAPKKPAAAKSAKKPAPKGKTPVKKVAAAIKKVAAAIKKKASPAAKAPANKSVAKAAPAKAAKAAPAKAPPAKAAPAKEAPTKAAPTKAAAAKAAPTAPAQAAPSKTPKAPSVPPPRPRVEISEPEPVVVDNTPRVAVRTTTASGEALGAHPDAQLTQEELETLHTKLVTERERVVAGFDRHLQEALGENEVMPDETDMAQRSTEQAYLIRFADKERKLLSEIEHALEKMRAGEYGVCEGTEEPIGYKRLELRPWTRYSVAYKEQMERERSQHRR
jgi:DnaK suppressor protein